MKSEMKRKRVCVTAILTFVSVSVIGCGSGLETARVEGKVTHSSKPVTAGTIVFTPVDDAGKTRDGKPALAEVQEDGSFSLRTYEPGDGAILGKHRVSYSPPEEDEPESDVTAGADGEESKAPSSKPQQRIEDGLEVAPDSQIVEVTKGDNTINIKLVISN